MVHSSFKGVTAGAVELNDMARAIRAMTRTVTRSGAVDAISRRKTMNTTRPSGRLVRLGLLIVVDMKTLGSGTRNPSGSNSLS